MKNIYVISPSGKFYGSEQVLFDFLKTLISATLLSSHDTTVFLRFS